MRVVASRALVAAVLAGALMSMSLMSRKNPPMSASAELLNCAGPISGENRVAPPLPPILNSFTRFAVSVERRFICVVYRSDGWLPVFGNPGNCGSRPLVVSGVDFRSV